MWLKKGLETPSNDTIICWDLSQEGLVLLFSEGVISNNTSVAVRCHASFATGRGDTATVEIRELTFRDGQAEMAANSLATNFITISAINDEN